MFESSKVPFRSYTELYLISPQQPPTMSDPAMIEYPLSHQPPTTYSSRYRLVLAGPVENNYSRSLIAYTLGVCRSADSIILKIRLANIRLKLNGRKDKLQYVVREFQPRLLVCTYAYPSRWTEPQIF